MTYKTKVGKVAELMSMPDAYLILNALLLLATSLLCTLVLSAWLHVPQQQQQLSQQQHSWPPDNNNLIKHHLNMTAWPSNSKAVLKAALQ